MKFLQSNRKFIVLFALAVIVLFFSASFFQKKFDAKNDLMKFETPAIPSFSFPERICNIKDYGAISEKPATKNISDAISDCAEKGGGKVVIPEGRWLTGPINLKSNINLYLEKDAEMLFSTNFNDYLPPVFSRFEGIELYNYSPLIYTKDCENIAITGKGTLNGQGEAWWSWKRESLQISGTKKLYEMISREIPTEKRIFGNTDDALRPSFIQFINCKNILLEDFRIKNGPMWTIHPTYSENVLIKNIAIETSEGPNTDGIVIDSSKNVTIDGAFIDSGDDAIAIKSGKDKDGLAVNKPSENIHIKNCDIKEGHSGVAIGSEMSGGIRNVLVEDCKIKETDYGIHIKSMRGRGGIVEDIYFKNISLDKARIGMIRLDMQYGTPQDPDSKNLPAFQNLYFKNISCRRADSAIYMRGLPESPIKNTALENIEASSKKEILKENIIEEKFKDVRIKVEKKYTPDSDIYELFPLKFRY